MWFGLELLSILIFFSLIILPLAMLVATIERAKKVRLFCGVLWLLGCVYMYLSAPYYMYSITAGNHLSTQTKLSEIKGIQVAYPELDFKEEIRKLTNEVFLLEKETAKRWEALPYKNWPKISVSW